MQPRQREILEAMGIVAFVPRTRAADAPAAAAEAPVAAAEAPVAVAARADAPDWDTLAATVRECRLCGLCETRTQTVFGTGNRSARLMVIGEAPGAEEDRQGEPFVGRAGMLLNSMLRAAGFERGEVMIVNL
ncbi:MAG: uracil-DNA glycosylase, partial [Steroidobacteraceae bacterium]